MAVDKLIQVAKDFKFFCDVRFACLSLLNRLWFGKVIVDFLLLAQWWKLFLILLNFGCGILIFHRILCFPYAILMLIMALFLIYFQIIVRLKVWGFWLLYALIVLFLIFLFIFITGNCNLFFFIYFWWMILKFWFIYKFFLFSNLFSII